MSQNSNRHLMGDSLSSLIVKELKQLENRLERGITRIRRLSWQMKACVSDQRYANQSVLYKLDAEDQACGISVRDLQSDYIIY
ncbi:hypothetical protein WN943_015316 [Citrus x changshan-huyou]